MILLHLKGHIVPKARPRVTVNGTYMPVSYRKWKDDAIKQLNWEYNGEQIDQTELVSITLVGKHRRSGDLDNIAGAILDALVQSGILKGDNLMVIPSLTISLKYDRELSPVTDIRIVDKRYPIVE